MVTLHNWRRAGSNILIPAYGIFVFNSATAAPDGTVNYTAPGARSIMATTNDAAIGTTGGSNSTGGSTSTSGLHGTVYGADNGCTMYGYPGHGNPTMRSESRASEGAHSHSWSASYTPSKNNARLVQAQEDLTTIPNKAVLFSASALNFMAGFSLFTGYTGLLTESPGVACFNSGASVSGGIASASDSHNHVTGVEGGLYEIYQAHQTINNGGGSHSHSWAPVASFSPVKAILQAWEASEELRKSVGQPIIMYDQAGVPDKWLLCDGTNGTPDLSDCFIGFGSSYAAKSGSNTLTLSGDTSSQSHSHSYNTSAGNVACTVVGHTGLETHSHSAGAVVGFIPPWFKLKFIMYEG